MSAPIVDFDELRKAEDIVRKYDARLADEIYALGCLLGSTLQTFACQQCGRTMNPAERMLGPVCGDCCRANHRQATS